MRLSLVLFPLAALATSACVEVADDLGATTLPDPVGVPAGDPTVLALRTTSAISQDRFVTSAACALCHSNHGDATAMRDTEGRDIGPFNLWQGTMMANAARDPLWRAMVSAEVARTPAAGAAIESKCMRCHAPMASETAHKLGREPEMADLTTPGGGLQQLAMDGVSCSVCHQIQPDNLGTEESFSGGFTIGSSRVIYGPHQNPATGPMQAHVNYTPTYATHVTQSSLCATCHTLRTHALDEDGVEGGGTFNEQSTFLEWQNSVYGAEAGGEAQTCQSCHMPTTSEEGVEIRTRIARAPPGFDFNVPERSPFGRHAFAGANTLMPAILLAERDILQPQATDEAFEATIREARHRLTELTAELALDDVTAADGELSFAVTIHSSAGHKLPTGFPSRRAWLKVIVSDADGEIVFSSGAHDEGGRIVDHAGRVLDIEKADGPFEPHHAVIRRSDEVQIYEQVMADAAGARTPSIMRAAGHAKDNRILPRGYADGHASHEITRAIGVVDDADFVAGSDTVRYVVTDRDARAAHIEVTLVYQSLGARFARDLFQVDTAEVRGFRTMLERANAGPEPVSQVVADVP